MSHRFRLTFALRGAMRVVAVSLIGVIAFGGMASPAHAATLGDVSTVAVADYSCSSQTVTVYPSSNEPLDGNFSVYAYAQVYDFNLRRWITGDQWRPVDGITGLTFHVTAPYTYAKITYARLVNGVWNFASDWVTVTDDIDNSSVFCTTGF